MRRLVFKTHVSTFRRIDVFVTFYTNSRALSFAKTFVGQRNVQYKSTRLLLRRSELRLDDANAALRPISPGADPPPSPVIAASNKFKFWPTIEPKIKRVNMR